MPQPTKKDFGFLRFPAIGYGLLIAFFTLFRLGLLATQLDKVGPDVSTGDVWYAFFMGWRFDTVIACYILAVPVLALCVAAWAGARMHRPLLWSNRLILLLGSLAIFVCAVDIPYFGQFFARFSVTAFEWVDSPAFVLKMIFQEPRYWMGLIPLIGCIYLFARWMRTVRKRVEASQPFLVSVPAGIGLTLATFALVFIGIRGRLEQKSPIRIGTAYFSTNAFVNQLGLNPNFTLIRSYIDSRQADNKQLKLMDDAKAVALVRSYLGLQSTDPSSPIARAMNNGEAGTKHNVVVVIMESMSANKMTRHGNPDHLTPFLDSIANRGYYFENIYTAGIHTFNGIYGTLFSFPALWRQHPMKNSAMPRYYGLATALKKNGYKTIYFTTHDEQFDNVGGFLRYNDFDSIISKSDYPTDKVATTLGVPDDYFFEYSIPVLNKLSGEGKPFLATFMTASDHGPFYVPPYFTGHQTDVKKKVVEYADFSLGKFIHMAQQQPWFKNTLFVFVADHGGPLDVTYDMSVSYNHSPLIFYNPNLIDTPKVFTGMGGQIDVYPSIMGFLKLPYTNRTVGIDLFSQQRPYIFCGADDKYGVYDHDWYLVVHMDKSVALYKYQSKDTHNYAAEFPEVVRRMKEYAEANLQVTQYVIRSGKQ